MESAIDHPAPPDTSDEAERRRDLLVEVSKLDSPSRARAFSQDAHMVNWFRVIVDLERAGYGVRAMEKKTGLPRATLNDWKCEVSRPSHFGGEQLIALWMIETGLPRERLPLKTGGQLSAARVK